MHPLVRIFHPPPPPLYISIPGISFEARYKYEYIAAVASTLLLIGLQSRLGRKPLRRHVPGIAVQQQE